MLCQCSTTNYPYSLILLSNDTSILTDEGINNGWQAYFGTVFAPKHRSLYTLLSHWSPLAFHSQVQECYGPSPLFLSAIGMRSSLPVHPPLFAALLLFPPAFERVCALTLCST